MTFIVLLLFFFVCVCVCVFHFTGFSFVSFLFPSPARLRRGITWRNSPSCPPVFWRSTNRCLHGEQFHHQVLFLKLFFFFFFIYIHWKKKRKRNAVLVSVCFRVIRKGKKNQRFTVSLRQVQVSVLPFKLLVVLFWEIFVWPRETKKTIDSKRSFVDRAMKSHFVISFPNSTLERPTNRFLRLGSRSKFYDSVNELPKSPPYPVSTR